MVEILDDSGLPTYLATDASSVGIGAVLYQIKDEKKRYIRFFSKSLSKQEKGYSAVRRELLAITKALETFRYYLYGRKFHLQTDSRALTFFYTQKKLNPMLMSAAEILFEFDFWVTHLPGIQNVLPDALSRMWPNHSLNTRDHLDLVSFFIDSSGKIDTVEDYITTKAFLATVDLENLEIVAEHERESLLNDVHLEGHFGAKAMVQKLQTLGKTWPGVYNQAHLLVQGCLSCQKFNVGKVGFHPLESLKANQPMDHLVVDMAGPFPLSHNLNKYVLLGVDVSTRFVWLFPLPDDQTLTIARCLNGLFLIFGFPKIIQSDRGGAFVSKVIDALCSLGSIDQRLILPYNPRTNGIIEVQVRTMKKVLYKELEGALQSWCLFIPAIMYFMNKKISEVTGTTPFAAMFGRAPNPFKDYSGQEITESEKLQHRIDFMNHVLFPGIYAHSLAVIKGRQDIFNKRNRIVKYPFFKLGSVVLYKDPNITSVTPSNVPRWTPMRVHGYGDNLTYHLASLDGVLLPTPTPVNQIKPRPALKVMPTKNQTLEIETILAHRLIDTKISLKDSPNSNFEYLVKWKYVAEDHPQCRTWAKHSDFDQPAVIADYWKRNQLENKKRS